MPSICRLQKLYRRKINSALVRTFAFRSIESLCCIVSSNYSNTKNQSLGIFLKKVKSNYFIVRPKVDQRAGLLSLPHLGIFAIRKREFKKIKLIYIATSGCNTRGAGQCVSTTCPKLHSTVQRLGFEPATCDPNHCATEPPEIQFLFATILHYITNAASSKLKLYETTAATIL